MSGDPVPSGSAPVAGADGAPDGWAVVIAHPDGRLEGRLLDRLDSLVADVRAGRLAALAVDMPIGLLADHPRPADVAARAVLGPRRSSVFATPVRACLDAADYDDARRRSRAAAGVAPSKQAWNLLPRIAELDRLVVPADQDRIVEAHPELAFHRLAGGPLPGPKGSGLGIRARRTLLVSCWGADAYGSVLADVAAPETDVADALALAGTARRVAAGGAIRLGGQTDPTGKRAEIVY